MQDNSNPPNVIYKTIERFSGYRFGDDGSVWSSRNLGGWPKVEPWRKLNPLERNPHGATCSYQYVSLPGSHGKQLLIPVHRLILEAFCGPCPKGYHGCHWDGNGLNNSLPNIRWDTPKSNCADRARHGRQINGQIHHLAALNDEQVLQIRSIRNNTILSYAKIANIFGVTKPTIVKICLRKTWKHLP